MKVTRREAVALTAFGAAATTFLPRSALAQMGHEGHGQMDMSPPQPAEPTAAASAGDGMQWWTSMAKNTTHPARTIEATDRSGRGPDGQPVAPAPRRVRTSASNSATSGPACAAGTVTAMRALRAG